MDAILDELSHIALVVADPKRTAALFQKLFDAPVVNRIDEDGHDETLIRLGKTWFQLAIARIQPQRTGDHIAFYVTEEGLRTTLTKLQDLQMEYILARGDTALYFFDYDNHLFELDTVGMAELGTNRDRGMNSRELNETGVSSKKGE
jgi:catechol 2,3-dioxygenase-like lactoylglutathione lyase family enzyme